MSRMDKRGKDTGEGSGMRSMGRRQGAVVFENDLGARKQIKEEALTRL